MACCTSQILRFLIAAVPVTVVRSIAESRVMEVSGQTPVTVLVPINVSRQPAALRSQNSKTSPTFTSAVSANVWKSSFVALVKFWIEANSRRFAFGCPIF